LAKSLIITEKPSVAQEFARILGVSGRNDGYIENSDYVITWCVGHLVEMVYPEVYDEKYKKWKLEDLPFLPKDYKYDVIPAVCKQYDVVHKMLHREDIDTVYWAGDAGKDSGGRAGLYLFRHCGGDGRHFCNLSFDGVHQLLFDVF
jgi:DNA topoisomerase-3